MSLLRIFAAAAVMTAGAAAGWRKRRALRDRAVFLGETAQLLERFAVETEFSGRTPDELLERESGRFARLVKDSAQETGDIRRAWENACAKLPKNARETALLKGLGRSLGTSDKENTVRMLRACASEMSGLRDSAEADFSKQGNALFQVGTLCGIGAAVMII